MGDIDNLSNGQNLAKPIPGSCPIGRVTEAVFLSAGGNRAESQFVVDLRLLIICFTDRSCPQTTKHDPG